MCTLSVIAIGRYQDRYKCAQSIMLWNWQLSDWPAFSFDAALLREAEERFLKGAGVVVGSMHHLDGDARQGIVIELISQEMVDSSAIERSEERRVGKECVSTCRSRWSPTH